ncbi:Acetyltransferase (GNAT) domain-containing protein [Natronincola peptidivorans]|uniref:Acetyltransferase (GNAT) domain-containing protein n=1 Tax=Natronincola peptidivorans TaxID=426128 RepID=A0A1H9Y8L7_9FIRM|nr:GNAT family N-acetyltransferase [Natronincola peptidivorans]SES65280.1 Acetyltransferase (GNAT) domain-containing protein [Natronincola peptidivorans]
MIKRIEKEETWPLRHKVLWPNKGIEHIKLKDDDNGIHFGLFYEGNLISVISLFIDQDRGQFRKFATHHEEQGKGYGSKLLLHLIEEAKKLGVKVVWCNARKDKCDYYKKFGLAETEKVFSKDGTQYIIMEKHIR